MKHSLEVCLVALALVAGIMPVAAQSEAHAVPALQKGISVQLSVTSHAVPMPDADQEDALIVSVTNDGRVYFGVDPLSPAALAEKVKRGLSKRTERKIYVKADARTSYANVVKVLEAVRAAGVEALNLLTAQPDSPKPGTLVPPKGLEVLVGPPSSSGSEPAVVQVLSSGKGRPSLRFNSETIPRANLQSRLTRFFQNRSDKVVQIKAEGRLPFGAVVDAIDACRSTGARIVLAMPGKAGQSI
jgi:biopolymer transport protein TolR